jgi:signal transduction histidine kinase
MNSGNVGPAGLAHPRQPDMQAQAEDPAREIKRLQRCINDLVSLLALPAIWTGSDPFQIVHLLLDALLRMLSLEFAYARVDGSLATEPIEVVHIADSRQPRFSPKYVAELVREWLGSEDRTSRRLRNQHGKEDIWIFPVPLGVRGEHGMIALGCDRADFPQQTESLLLSVAANQASIGLREADLLREQKRIADELDHRVAERTEELAASNEELRKEIAERKLVEEQRKQSQEALAKARSELANVARVTSLGVLTASIAHEVNQPLSGIITNASTCLRMLDANPPNVEGARETARRTIRDGHRASDVIARLRTLYSKKEPALEPMDLNEVAQEVTALASTEIQKTGVTLRQEFADGLPPAVGDRIQLQQVILNLLRNAADAMSTVDDRPKELLVRTEPDVGNHVRLSVKDSGVGYTPEVADKIFQAFYTTKADGMGIGLSVSRSIIEAHQGRLWATPNDGPGCTFSFVIPCTPARMADPESRASRADSSANAA